MGEENKSDSTASERRRIEPVPKDYEGPTFWLNSERYRVEDEAALDRQLEEEDEEWCRQLHDEWAQTEGGRLCVELYEKFQAYKTFLEGPRAGNLFSMGDFKEHRFFARTLKWAERGAKHRAESDRKKLEKAQLAERCEHIHASGARCGSPKMNGGLLCYKHQKMEEARALKLDLGTMEDPDGIHLGIMKLQRAVIEGTLEGKQVTQLTNLMQIAAWNARTKTSRKEERPKK